tara:strand:+ start:1831 stop:1944 length:114 start_codon:yes stop_codon:yes gene_type:complete
MYLSIILFLVGFVKKKIEPKAGFEPAASSLGVRHPFL